MSSYFTVKSKKKLSDLPIGERIETSDFATLCNDGTFVQLEYVEVETKSEPYKVKPGLFAIEKSMNGLKLKDTSFVKDDILSSFVATKEIRDKIDCFFNRLHIYKDHGIEIPMRAMLLHGPGGSGKTTSLLSVVDHYLPDGKTLVIVWPTDKIDAFEVKDFLQTFEYTQGIEKVIMIVEDLGGVEIDQVKLKSTASLLSLLDNKEKTFRLPTFIAATTNHPEVFLGNLTNRPGRFADKIEVGFPSRDARKELLKFFAKVTLDEDTITKIGTKKFDEFTADHIRETILRSALHDLTISQAMDAIVKEIDTYKKMFEKGKQKLGIGVDYED